MQNYNNKFKNVTIGYLIIFGSFMLISHNYFNKVKDRVFTNVNLEVYNLTNNILQVDNDLKHSDNEKIDEVINKEEKSEYFIGTLDIPKINLKRGFVNPDSADNNVSKNLEIVDTSDMPDVKHGNFILAAHSGTSHISYFMNLYKLVKGDTVNINYKGIKYIYKIRNIYLQEKTGKIGIYRNMNKTTLTLVTCTQDDDYHQTIYIAELIGKY